MYVAFYLNIFLGLLFILILIFMYYYYYYNYYFILFIYIRYDPTSSAEYPFTVLK